MRMVLLATRNNQKVVAAASLVVMGLFATRLTVATILF
jgi:hypothetical protein